MKHIFFILFIIFSFGFNGYMPSAEAKILKNKTHQDWDSFILDTYHQYARIATYNSRLKDTLAIDFYPGYCGYGSIKIISALNNKEDSYEKITTHGSIRIDTNAIRDVTYTVSSNNGFIFVVVDSIYSYEIFEEAKNGKYIRFKIINPYGKNIYEKFSLMGFTAAYGRALNICKNIENYDSDERYFNNDNSKKHIPESLPDASYF